MITQSALDFLQARLVKTGMELPKAASPMPVSRQNDFKSTLDKALEKAPQNARASQSDDRKVKSPAADRQQVSRPKRDDRTLPHREEKVDRPEEPKAQKPEIKVKQMGDDEKNSPHEEKASEVKTNENYKEQAVLNSLSQILGVDQGELENLLKTLNIKVEDLLESLNSSPAFEKLSDALSLNGDESKAFKEILNALSDELKKGMPLMKPDSAAAEKAPDKEPEGWIKLDNVEVKWVEAPKPDVKKVLDKLKTGLDDIAQKLTQDPQKALEGLKAKIESAIKENAAEVMEAPEESGGEKAVEAENIKISGENSKSADKIKGTEKKDEEPLNIKKEEKNQDINVGEQEQESKNNSSSGDEKASSLKVKSPEAHKTQESGNRFNEALNNQVQKDVNTDKITVEKKEPVHPKHEILKQVVDKAKVITNGEKSEMVMDLKPESLGKLALKIVTERGLVVAKFTAESQQVKEAIEANMQLLKDSLEKQGLSVQGFSVSVGDNSSRNQENFSQMQNSARQAAKAAGTFLRGSQAVSAALESNQRVPNYGQGESRINLTA